MPGVDGLEVCRRLRATGARRRRRGRTRVLMLTARDSVDDRVAGLDDGADDYLVKPFAFAELVGPGAHAAAARRRPHRRRAARWATSPRHRPPRGSAGRPAARPHRQGVRAPALLHEPRAGEVLSQEHLLEHVWDEHADPFTNTVRVTVGTLRRKLAVAASRQLIETVIGRGYRLRADDAVTAAERPRPSRRPAGRWRRGPPACPAAGSGSIRFRLTVLYSVFAVRAGGRGRAAGIYLGAGGLARRRAGVADLDRHPAGAHARRAWSRSREDRPRPRSARSSAGERARRSTSCATYSFARSGCSSWPASAWAGSWPAGCCADRPHHRRRPRHPGHRPVAPHRPRRAADDELKDLADTFDGMLGRLDEAFEGQRRFIQEASHELRNPLAVIRTNLDVALADPDASAEDLRRRRRAGRPHRRADEPHSSTTCSPTPATSGRPCGASRSTSARWSPRRRRVHARPAATRVAADRRRRRHAIRPRSTATGPRCARPLANLVDNAVRLAPEGSTITVGRRDRTDRGCGWRWRTRARASDEADQRAGVPTVLAGRRERRPAGRAASGWPSSPDPDGPRRERHGWPRAPGEGRSSRSGSPRRSDATELFRLAFGPRSGFDCDRSDLAHQRFPPLPTGPQRPTPTGDRPRPPLYGSPSRRSPAPVPARRRRRRAGRRSGRSHSPLPSVAAVALLVAAFGRGLGRPQLR